MANVTSSKIDRFVEKITSPNKSMTAVGRVKALEVFPRLPITTAQMKLLRDVDDIDFTPAIMEKEQQRFMDVEEAMTEAAENGIDNLHDFCQWMGIDPNSSFEDILDKAHLYKRVGDIGHPATVKLG